MNYIRLFLFSRAPRRCWARRGAPRRTRNGEPPNEGAAESISFSRAVPAPPRRRPPPAPAPPPARARGPAGPPGAAAPAHPRPARRGPAPRARPSGGPGAISPPSIPSCLHSLLSRDGLSDARGEKSYFKFHNK